VLGDAQHGTNGFDVLGYGGPCSPAGPPHWYVFTLYALGNALHLTHGPMKEEFHQAMVGHVLANGTFVGTYGR